MAHSEPNSRGLCLIWLLVIAVNCFAQSQPQPQSDATISGTVRLQGRGVSDCPVFIWPIWSSDIPQNTKPIKTDRDGRFHRSVPPGNYEVWVSAPPFYVVVDGKLSLQPRRFTVDGGEMIDDINFDLQRGGVVTGKVTLDAKPVIDLNVSLVPAQSSETMMGSTTPSWDKAATDDRGIYRFFGVPPGQYKVVAGDLAAISTLQGQMALPPTFFPDQPEEAKAKTIIVEGAKEVTDIDIKMAQPLPMFTIRGVVVDEQSGAPVSAARVGLTMYADNEIVGGRSGNDYSNEKGQFMIQNLPPGRYALFTPSQFNSPDADHFGQSEQFEISDHDIEGFVFKTQRTSSVAGSVVMEGQPGAPIPVELKTARFFVMSIPKTPARSSTKMIQLGPDGSFLVTGLTPGTLNFQFALSSGQAEPPFRIVRAELQGRSPIEIAPGENLTGLKLVLAEAISSLRGRIQFVGGLTYAQLSGSAALYFDKKVVAWGNVDPSGNFLIEHVAAGLYRLVVNVSVPGTTPQSTHTEQTVAINLRSVSEVTVWLDPQPIKTPVQKP